MKKIKLSIYAALLSLAFVSCESETTDLVEGTVTPTKHIVVEFSDSNLKTDVLEDGGVASYQVSLSKPLPVDGVVTFDISSSDGSTETTNGLGEISYNEVVIPAGQTSADVTFTFNDDNLADSEETYTISIKDFKTSEVLNDYFFTLNQESSLREVTVFDELPLSVETSLGDTDLILNWPGGEDLDLYLRSEPTTASTVYANSWFSQPESVTISQSLPDGDYYLGLDNYNVATPYSIPCTLTISFPDGKSELLLSSLDTTASAAANGGPDIWFKITKVTNGDKVVYTIIQLS